VLQVADAHVVAFDREVVATGELERRSAAERRARDLAGSKRSSTRAR
jgi:hypothetical protein